MMRNLQLDYSLEKCNVVLNYYVPELNDVVCHYILYLSMHHTNELQVILKTIILIPAKAKIKKKLLDFEKFD